MLVHAVGRSELPPYQMPDRFRTDVAYFMTPPGESGVPPLGAGEYWIRRSDALRWLDDLVVRVVSPLDAHAQAELELTEDQEGWLEWMVQNNVEHIRLA